MLTSQAAAHDRAKQKIVEAVRHAIQAQQCGDLRPVADLVQQDVHDDLPWRRCQDMDLHLEILRNIQVLGGKRLDKFLQFLPALLTELKERFDAVVRDGGRRGPGASECAGEGATGRAMGKVTDRRLPLYCKVLDRMVYLVAIWLFANSQPNVAGRGYGGLQQRTQRGV